MIVSRLTTAISIFALMFSTVAHAAEIEDIIDRGSIRVGIAEFVPWAMRSKSGDLIGYEVDVAEKIAADMGVKAELISYDWDKIIGALENGEIDIISSGMAITPGRALRINFSRPVATSGIGIATNTAMTDHIETLGELNKPDIIITTVAETLAESVSKTLFNEASVNVFRDKAAAEKEVIEGRAHAYLATMPEIQYLTMKNSGKVDMPVAEPLLANSEGIAVRKGDQELLNFINSWVTARTTDKWIATTRDYWFDSLEWASADDE